MATEVPFGNKEELLSLGVSYPHMSLKDARTKREEAKTLLVQGIDPAEKRKAERHAAADTFGAVVREWFARHVAQLTPGHADKIIRRFERDIFPWLGEQPAEEVTPRLVLDVLRHIEARGVLESVCRSSFLLDT